MKIRILLCIILGSFLICCAQVTRKDKPAKTDDTSAAHYDLEHPYVFKMPDALNEISGITFQNGDPDILYAEQDEDGILYSVRLGSSDIIKTKFHKKGDFEDVQILDGQVLMLRSDGVVYTFPLIEARNGKVDGTRVSRDLVPPGEYEGLYADNKTAKVYLLCKSCDEKHSSTATGFVFTMEKNGMLVPAGNFTMNVKDIAAKAGSKKISFQPSALAKNPVSGEWFILSSVNKMLVIANADWTIKSVLKLDGSLFNQPEGITFDKTGNLYISNERGVVQSASIMKISRH